MVGKTAYPARSLDELVLILQEIDNISPLVRLLLDFEARTGLRNIDARNMQWSTVLVNGVIRDSFSVVQSKSFSRRLTNGTSEANAKRLATVTVNVSPELKELIEEIRELTGGHKLMFQSLHHHAKEDSAITIQYVNRVLKRVAVKLKLPYQLSTHSMRKSFTEMVLSMPGATLVHAQNMLGHGSLSSLQHYVNTFRNDNAHFTNQISFSVYSD